jgi:hypothetical protein
MNVKEEKAAIKNAKKIYLAVDGIRASLTKTAANELMFRAKGYSISGVFTNHIVIEHTDNCDIR